MLLLLLPIFGFSQTFNGMVEKELINYVISFSLPTDPDNTVYYTLNNNNKYLISYSNSDATINNSNKSNVWWIDDTNSLNILHDKR